MHVAYIALGGNQGDSRNFLDQAVVELNSLPGCQVHSVSSYYRAKPVGGPEGQGEYLNACAGVFTSLDPTGLMKGLLEIERKMGRIRAVANGPRTLDMDLLLFDDLVVKQDLVEVPHPRMADRPFVLRPLCEIAPHAIHPVSGKMIQELLYHLEGIMSPRRGLPDGLAGKRFLVTGSTTGIGREIGLELAGCGALVIFHGRGIAGAPESLIRLATHRAGAAHFLPAELGDPIERKRLLQQAWDLLGGLDGLVLNAGADILTGKISQFSPEEKLRELYRVDLESTFFLAREIGARMNSSPAGGVIVTMGWDHAARGFPGDSGQLFAAVKGAVSSFTKSLALTLAPKVRVNCVAPGWTKTRWGESASNYWQEKAVQDCPLQRWGTPQDVAWLVKFLSSSEAGFINGQTIAVNGGAV
ncbi:MAG: 2-amino-4-hydroxy-6-hydroxymethyldihydropteridine diphosphokinase [Gemmataceae bacterium]|nr:2-amino-4-hydroxy-6-hydroxymethyldihydropteridine diphosphokinase [Gemmataceae bacterium]